MRLLPVRLSGSPLLYFFDVEIIEENLKLRFNDAYFGARKSGFNIKL